MEQKDPRFAYAHMDPSRGDEDAGRRTASSGANFPVPLRCAECNQENPSHMRYCKQCGAKLPGIDVAARQTAPEVSAQPARLVTINYNGSDGDVIPLDQEQVDVGRSGVDVDFADDPYLSSRHARIVKEGAAYKLIDLDSVNGVYVRIRGPVRLTAGDFILLGQQVLRFEVEGGEPVALEPAYQLGVRLFGTPEVARLACLVQQTTAGVPRNRYWLHRDETVLGRESGDIVFTDDPFLSRRHAAVTLDRTTGGFVLNDLGSSNGTCIRIRGIHRLRQGDQIRFGRQLLRFEDGSSEVSKEGHD